MIAADNGTHSDAMIIIDQFSRIAGTAHPDYEISVKAEEPYLVIYVGAINDEYYHVLDRLNSTIEPNNKFYEHVFFRVKKPRSWLRSMEVQILQRLLSESLTVGPVQTYSPAHLGFIPFAGGEDQRITNKTNHIIYGRRGAGKSSLLRYCASQVERDGLHYAWLPMQQFQGRSDYLAVWQVLLLLADELAKKAGSEALLGNVTQRIRTVEGSSDHADRMLLQQFLPQFGRAISEYVQKYGDLYILVDDLYLVSQSLQPLLLSALYSFSRGNRIYLKISSIENFTRLFDDETREGFQTPGDAEVIRLDRSLINPKSACDHISKIIESYVKYVGIPSMKSIAGSELLERLTWVSAGVPRDAMYLFNNAVSKALAKARSRIAVEDVNMAAADYMTEKESFAMRDSGSEGRKILDAIEDIKSFCIKENHSNVFAIHIESSNERYQTIKKISDLRFIHIIHQGFTRGKAGERFEGVLLDYSYYTGFRRSRGVKEFIIKLQTPSAMELRKINVYDYNTRLANGPV